ncbi:MAG TPA: hypothetical protein VLW06_11705 [Terriglobales bacterium]|nr:hypothetical protein [Terriglobales bacterium]
MGSGKTAVLAEASDILSLRKIVHAAVDLDALGLAYLPRSVPNDQVLYENLRSTCKNYAAQGVRRFLLARAVENEAQLRLCREIFPAQKTMVCRLIVDIQTMERRIENRESGILRREYIARVKKLSDVLDRARLEDFIVSNEDRHLTEVATEVLVKAAWIRPTTA